LPDVFVKKSPKLLPMFARCVCEKISQIVAQTIFCQNFCITFTAEKVAPKFELFFKKTSHICKTVTQMAIWSPCPHPGLLKKLTDLPALQEQRPVDGSKPHDAVAGLKVAQLVTLLVQVMSQALEQLRGARLDHSLFADGAGRQHRRRRRRRRRRGFAAHQLESIL
jgi:hypothetical protein